MTTLPLPEEVLPATTGPTSRRRSWLLLAVVALLVMIYLVLWSTYASTHLGERYRMAAPGASASRLGGDFRVLSLVRTETLTDAEGRKPQLAEAGATFVVAEIEVVQRRVDPFFLCAVDLLGPDERVWASTYPSASRKVPTCSSDDVVPQQPLRFEAVFVVPQRYVDQVVGVALTDSSTAERSWVLTPPS